MANIINPSSMLADSLAEFSRAAHKAFAELESQSRLEITRALAETRSAVSERDKALDDLHKGLLEVQSWKQECSSSKSALVQAELTMSHQAETLASHADTIAQLKRELTQWKDQARNWQEHFLRVEQERCAISSKLEEIMSDRLQYSIPSPLATNIFTPAKGRYSQVAKSAPSTTSKLPRGTSPNSQFSNSKPSNRALREGDLSSPQEHHNKSSRITNMANHAEASTSYIDVDQPSRDRPRVPASEKAPRKTNGASNSKPKQQSQGQAIGSSSQGNRSSTVIRRVQAVISVKREESEDEQAEFSPQSGSSQLKEESAPRKSASARTPAPRHEEQRSKPRRRRDEESMSPEGDEEEEEAPQKRGRLRHRSQINYQESDYEEEDEDEDELMMGAEDNHEEVYGMRQVEKQPHPTKKRRISGR